MFKLIKRIKSGDADLYVGGKESTYLKRWYLIPQNRFINIYLHQFLRSDADRALHDHPWRSLSIILKGSYQEETSKGIKRFNRWSIIPRHAEYAHRVILDDDKNDNSVWTLFMTGPKVREWGFLCPKGWTHWKEFVDVDNNVHNGKGCP